MTVGLKEQTSAATLAAKKVELKAARWAWMLERIPAANSVVRKADQKAVEKADLRAAPKEPYWDDCSAEKSGGQTAAQKDE